MSILTFHSEDGDVKNHLLTQPLEKALKKVNVSEIAKEAETARESAKVKETGKAGFTDDLVYKFKEVAHSLLIAVLRWEAAESRRGFVQSDPLSTHDTKLESVAIETWKLAKTHTIKFHQKYKDIPVYGAQVNVEIDEENELLAINSAIGIHIGIDKTPKIQSNELKDLIQKKTEHDLENLVLEPTLYYYFDSMQSRSKENKPQNGQWRLVYLVVSQIDKNNYPQMCKSIQKMVDYIVDAHTGEVVSELPRVKTIR
jgi:Zn-dependent metalloprotease